MYLFQCPQLVNYLRFGRGFDTDDDDDDDDDDEIKHEFLLFACFTNLKSLPIHQV